MAARLAWLSVLSLLPLACGGPSRSADEQARARCSAALGSILRAEHHSVTWWHGEPAPRRTLDFTPASSACADWAAASDASWLALERRGERLEITLDPVVAGSGLHRGVVTLRGAQSGAALLRFAIKLRAWAAPPLDARRKVLFVGVDGVRGDALEAASTPNFDALRRHGAYSETARTQVTAMPVSGPGWASILTGTEPLEHGVYTNRSADRWDRRFPTFLARAKEEAGLDVGAVVHWPTLADLVEATVPVVVHEDDDRVTQAAAARLAEPTIGVLFVHLDDPDHVGHDHGLEPHVVQYRRAIELSDLRIGAMIDAILSRPTFPAEDWLIVITSDHGGDTGGHGHDNLANRSVPLLFSGPSVVPGPMGGGHVSHMDGCPAVLRFLGLRPRRASGVGRHVPSPLVPAAP